MAIDLSYAAEGGMNPLTNKQRIGIRRKTEEEADRRIPGKGPFWRKKGKAAKHAARSRCWGKMEMLKKCSVFLMERKDLLLLCYYYYYHHHHH
jgi:hypothetical protein